MGFWENALAKIDAQVQQQAPTQEQQVAPGAWWQGATPQQPARQPLRQYQQPAPPLPAQDLCPRCSSDNYLEFPMDVSNGGTIPPGVGAVRKQCFDCRYPLYNATGDLISGRGMQTGTKVATKQVRQLNPGHGSATAAGLFDNAVHVPMPGE